MKKIKIILGLLIMSGFATAQEINQEKMDRDLEVAETILKGLVETKQTHVFWLGRDKQINAEYIEDYGVIITLPDEKNVFQFNMNKIYSRWPEVSEAVNYAIEDLESDNYITYYSQSTNSNQDSAQQKAMQERQREQMERHAEQMERHQEQMEKHQEELESQQEKWEVRQRDLEARQHDIEERARSFALRTLKSLNTDSISKVNFDKNLENIKLFMLDYGHIISQLKDDDKIKIIAKSNESNIYRVDNGTVERANNFNEFSAEIEMKDVRAYQSGKLTKEEAEKRIKINTKEDATPLAKDVAVFKSIMNRLYEADLSDTYFLKSDIKHQKIEGLGIIFYLNMASSQKAETYYSMPTQGNTQYNQTERSEKVKALYPQFETDLINNIFEYGKNISSLGDDAKLIFKVNNTECRGCGIPEKFEILINGETLKALKSGKMNEKEAKKEMKIITGKMQ